MKGLAPRHIAASLARRRANDLFYIQNGLQAGAYVCVS